MRRLQEISNEKDSMQTIAEITNVFEALASMHIAQMKNKVQQAQAFFDDLWNIYRQLRVDTNFRFGRPATGIKPINKDLFIVITAEGSFSGDIDQKLIHWMLKQYDPDKHDIIVVGHHGAQQLIQLGKSFKKYFKLPQSDDNVKVEPLVREIQKYKGCYVYYQTYVSLVVQDVKRMNLSSAVTEQGATAEKSKEVISEANYIFEPNSYEVASHLESSIINNMLGQVIFESKLAQYASRFQAMSAAHQKSDENVEDLQLSYNRTKRSIKDERIKEIMNGLRKTEIG